MAINNNQNTPNIAELAKSPYGDIEMTKYLYESGLQNIFNTYQQNVASLSQNKQTELQDAYTVREMSKKYLGEYASNVGMGDVSGNLLDIYGQYQSNLSDIERNYGQLEMGLQQQFQQQRQEGMNNLLMTEFGLESAKLNERERNVMYNIEMGQTNDLTDQEYLDREYQSGNISQEMYQNASMGIMDNQRTVEERQIWGQAARGELSKDELTLAYQEGRLSEEAYTQFFNAMDAQERQEASQAVALDLRRGNTEGLSPEQYLDLKLEEGVIDQTTYNSLLNEFVVTRETQRDANTVRGNILMGKIPEGLTVEQYAQQAFDQGLIDANELLTYTVQGFNEERAQVTSEVADSIRNAGGSYEESLQNQVLNGTITEEEADFILSSLQSDARVEFEQRLESGLYGLRENGTPVETQGEFLESFRGKIGEDQYQQLKSLLDEQQIRQEFNFPAQSIISNEALQSNFGISRTDIDFRGIDASVDNDSLLFMIKDRIEGGDQTLYAISNKTVGQEETEGLFGEADPSKIPTIDTLEAEYGTLEPNQAYSFDGDLYIYQDKNIRRLVPINTEQAQAQTQLFTDSSGEAFIERKGDRMVSINELNSENLGIGAFSGGDNSAQTNWINQIRQGAITGKVKVGDFVDFNYGWGQTWFVFNGTGFIEVKNVNPKMAEKIIAKGNTAWIDSESQKVTESAYTPWTE